MQRSIINKNPLDILLYIIVFIIYESISSIYLFLPPLLAVLFVLLAKALKNEDIFSIMIISFCLVVFEAEKGYMLFSSIIYLLLIFKFIIPKLTQNFSCNPCISFIYILLSYIGFFIFSLVLSNIFMLPIPSINYYIIYYIVIEFLIVSVL